MIERRQKPATPSSRCASSRGIAVTAVLVLLLAAMSPLDASRAQSPAEDEVVQLLSSEAPYHRVSPELFARLGWRLPDGGVTVKVLADAAPGGALDPRQLASIPAETLGYRAQWHEVRFRVYGLDWDIPGLHLVPREPLAELPTMVIINGGGANWYEFFLDPLNRPGLGQYLAQKVPVLLVTIPGNYRHGGWTEDDFGKRIPGYLLDRDVSPEEATVRTAVYTFRVVADGVEAIIEKTIRGPAVIVGHSTGGEIQFMLKNSGLREKLRDLSMGWGTGGHAGMQAMREIRGVRTADDYLHVSRLRPRTPDQYAGDYLGPLNPFWDAERSRQEIAAQWMGRERRRRAQFKQPLQDLEHTSASNLRSYVATQIRDTIRGNMLGVDADEVIEDLFSTMRSPTAGYRKMIWTTARNDTGHWHADPAMSRDLRVANEFREANPGIPVRVLVFDVSMTHYGHIERPRQLAGGLVAALRWLNSP